MGCSSSASQPQRQEERLLPVYRPFPYSANSPGAIIPPPVRSSIPPRTSENRTRPSSFQLRQQQYQLMNQLSAVNNHPASRSSVKRVSSSKHAQQHSRPTSTPSMHRVSSSSKHTRQHSRPKSTPSPKQMVTFPVPQQQQVPPSPPSSLVFPFPQEKGEDSSSATSSPSRKYFIQDPVQASDVDLQHPKMIEVSYDQWNQWQASQSPRTPGSPAGLSSSIDVIPPPTQHTQLSPGLLYTIQEDTVKEVDEIDNTVPKSRKTLISAKKPLRVPNPLGVPEKTIDAIPWLQEQLEKRRYRGLRTASDVSEFVAKHVGVTDATAAMSISIFRDNNIRPKLFVALTEEDLMALGVTTSSDRQKIVLAGADLVTAGHADLEGFLMTLLAYQFQLMLAMLFEIVREQTSPKSLINKTFQKFVESLDWYQQGYAGGKKELTTFQKQMLYIDFFAIKILEEEKGTASVDVGAVTREVLQATHISYYFPMNTLYPYPDPDPNPDPDITIGFNGCTQLVSKGLARQDDLRFYKLLGLNEAKLMETLEVRDDDDDDADDDDATVILLYSYSYSYSFSYYL